MKKILTMIMMLGFAAGFLSPVIAEEKGDQGGFKERMEGKMQKVFDQLSLSESQAQLLKENKQKHKAAKKELWEKAKQQMDAINEEIKKKDYDIAKINALHAQLKSSHNAMADERLSAILEVRKILTPEQFAKFSELMDKEKNKHFEKRF